MNDDRRMLALWLLPAPPAAEFFRCLVSDLAMQCDAPPFQPHLTLCGIRDMCEFRCEKLETLTFRAAIELQIDSLQYSEKYTKTLFVRFRINPQLSALRSQIASAVGEPESAEFDPHLSLIYKTMPAQSKAELARSIHLPFQRVLFDRMEVVSTPLKIESAEDVHAWRSVWARSFAGPNG